MKLKELKSVNETLDNKNNLEFVKQWLVKNLSLGVEAWSVQDELPIVVNANDDISISNNCKKIEVQFGKINGDFYAGSGIETLHGIPKLVTGMCDFSKNNNLKHVDAPLPQCAEIDLSDTNISSIKEVMSNLTVYANKLTLDNTKITSLEGIAEDAAFSVQKLHFSGDQWVRGGLGVLHLPGLREFSPGTFIPDVTPMPDWERAMTIIQKYVGRPNAIFDCQSELIEAGLEDYAQL